MPALFPDTIGIVHHPTRDEATTTAAVEAREQTECIDKVPRDAQFEVTLAGSVALILVRLDTLETRHTQLERLLAHLSARFDTCRASDQAPQQEAGAIDGGDFQGYLRERRAEARALLNRPGTPPSPAALAFGRQHGLGEG